MILSHLIFLLAQSWQVWGFLDIATTSKVFDTAAMDVVSVEGNGRIDAFEVEKDGWDAAKWHLLSRYTDPNPKGNLPLYFCIKVDDSTFILSPISRCYLPAKITDGYLHAEDWGFVPTLDYHPRKMGIIRPIAWMVKVSSQSTIFPSIVYFD